MNPAALLCLVSLVGPAQAREGVDAHGPVLPPGDGGVEQPLTGFHPARAAAGSISAGLTVEVLDRALVRYVDSGDSVVEQTLLGTAAGVNLGATWAPHPRVSLGLTAPVWLRTTGDTAGGPALGDVHLWAPVGLVLPAEDGTGFGLSVVPFADLPTGNPDRLVGDPRVGGGLLGATGWSSHAVVLTGNLGVEGRGIGGWEKLTGGPALRFGAAAAWLPRDDLALRAEWRHVADLGVGEDDLPDHEQLPSGAESPGEVLLTARGRLGSSLWWSAGVGRGVTQGVGAPRSRALVGFGWAPRSPEQAGPALIPEPAFSLTVRDPAGEPIPGAVVREAGEALGLTPAGGTLDLEHAPRWRKGVRVEAEGFLGADLARPEGSAAEVVLAWAPVPVAVRVADEQGRPLDAAVTLRSDAGEEQVAAVTGGVAEATLEPGQWTARIEAEGFGAQERGLVVDPGRRTPLDPEVILAPEEGGSVDLSLAVEDEEGAPVEGARVLVDGRPVGTTGSGGSIGMLGVAEGDHRVEVSADTFQTVDDYAFTVNPGQAEHRLALARDIGSVRVRARGPQGPVPDAVVRFFGPSRLPPTPLGDDGERTLVVRPGTWSVLVTSGQFGMQERTIVVPDDDNRLIEVEVVLRPLEDGDAALALRVVDPDGRPVSGATVLLDGEPLGSTSTGGTMRVQGLLPGARQLLVRGARYRVPEPLALVLVEGVQEQVVTLEWLPGTVHLTGRTPDAPLADAVARFSGPSPHPALDLGVHGEAWTTLEHGTWAVLVTSASMGMQQRGLQVPEDSRRLIEVDVVMSPTEAGLAELVLEVVGPYGDPVDGAEVLLDGTPLGATSNAGTAELRQLSAGRRTLQVRHSLYQTVSRDIELAEGQRHSRVQLAWAPGLVTVVARAGEEPVTDATLRFAGPSLYPPLRVDEAGRRRIALGAGEWQVLVAAPGFGLQQRRLSIAADQGPQELVFDLVPVGEGIAEVLVRVQGPDGEAVAGARVAVDGVEVGRTSGGGLLLLPERDPGTVSLAVVADHYRSAALDAFEIVEGRNERVVTLAWSPVPVAVRVADDRGGPVAAEVRFDGPAEVPPTSTDAGGVARVELRPGLWRVLASTEALGVRSAELRIAPGQAEAAVDLALAARRVDVTAAQVVIKEAVHFDFDRATLSPESSGVLDEVAATILAHAGIVRVQVQGHTDGRGDVAYNQRLSQQRAEAVVAALVERGVAPERLLAQGFGPTRPVADNESDEGRAANRRVQFEILEAVE